MADTVQIGTFDSSGRFTLLLDLNDGTNFSLVRDTLRISPLSGEQSIMAKSGRRYGGAKPVGAIHDNGVFEGEWYLNSAARTDDATWANFDALVAILQDASGGPYYLKFKTQGATRAVYHELKLPVPYDPLYRWIEMQGTKTLHIKVSVPIAPLAVGDPLDILDGFASDTLSDYTALLGAGTAVWSSAGVVGFSSTATKLFQHTARGYSVPDSQDTVKFRTGASASGTVRAVDTLLDANNYLFAEITGTQLRLGKRDGGAESTLGATVANTLAANTTYWLRVRKEGNNLFAELFTSAPSPMGTPAKSASATLSGGDATKFGAGVGGGDAWYMTPAATDWQLNAFNVEPYTYRNQTLPNSVTLPKIPGTAPAKVDWVVTPSGGTKAPIWALLGWLQKPVVTGDPAPLGVIEAEAANVISGFGVVADAAARGGNKLKVSTSGNVQASATYLIDPHTLANDAFADGQVTVELWARIQMDSTTVSPVLTAAAVPTIGGTRYTAEWGSSGKPLTVPAVSGNWAMVRLGNISLPTDATASGWWTLSITLSATVAVGGLFALDYFVLVPARSRTVSPSGVSGGAFPKFTTGTFETVRRIRSDLAGFIGGSTGPLSRDAGLGGQLIEMAPGDVTAVMKLSSDIPDDPTVATDAGRTSEQLSHSATVHFAVTPRYHLERSS